MESESKRWRETITVAVSMFLIAIGVIVLTMTNWYWHIGAINRAKKAEAALKVAHRECNELMRRQDDYWYAENAFLADANRFQFCDPRQMQKSIDLCSDTINENTQYRQDILRCEVDLDACRDQVVDLTENSGKLACTEKEVLASKTYNDCSDAAVGWMERERTCQTELERSYRRLAECRRKMYLEQAVADDSDNGV